MELLPDFLLVLRYLLVGGLVTVADMMVYSFLTGHPRRMARIPANVLSVTCGMALGFTLHFVFVFHPPEPLLVERAAKYFVTVGISVYGVQNLVIYTLAEFWRWPVRVAQCVARSVGVFAKFSDDFVDRITGKAAAALAGLLWNFVFFKWFVYL